MIKNIQRFISLVLLLLACVTMTYSQTVSDLSISDKLESYRDSLKRTPYEWHLPIMGKKIREMGFDIPYPNGVSFTYAHSKQDLLLSDAFVGFDPDELIPIDGFARFRSISSVVNAYTVRYDFWLLPFMNFYGIGGSVDAITNIQLGLPFEAEFDTKRKTGLAYGWGTVLGGAIGPMIISTDFAMMWTKMADLDQPNKSILFGARTGYLMKFRNPERNLAFLVGAQYIGINKAGSGKLELISASDKEKALGDLNGWYDNLTDREQEVLEPLYSGLANWLDSSESTNLYYKFNKRFISPWSMNVGLNFQYNKRYTLTGIYSFGSRSQLVVGLGYRFGIKGKNLLSGLQL
ncbi:hypothetical protein SAMN06265375_1011623 [Muriicola jejuensis]|uniref:DUF4421 domain-containing protein n=1 Tax=Muriicola jejuensis TaxID=504488 RepID=A0A6P0U745_9FLAO|nr:hypothetical protein [Muriicola jejuensis]NER08904.1 hypothetical protein [Muriicola jejuensis]SMP13023.1 hypothetical protein SAMN06265375_1011623 [Muriicola jejuensis]